MADSLTPGSKQKIPPIPSIESPLPNERVWEYQQRVKQTVLNRGSRYPAFSIEPLPWERQRLNTPMTAEDRFLRKQWLLDQKLSPNEPVYVEGAVPMFKARRLIRMPWNMAEVAMANVIGKVAAKVVRDVVPRTLMVYGVGLALLYHISYYPKDWEKHSGFLVYGSKKPKHLGEDHSKIMPDPEVFHTRGFDKRTSHFNARTSAAEQ